MTDNNLFSTVFYKSPLMMVITEAATGKIVDANERFIEFYGYGKDELVGKTLTEIGIMLNPNDREDVVHDLIKNKFIQGKVMRERTKSGAAKSISISVSMIELSGKEYFLGIGIDVTEKKQYQKQLQKINNGAEVAIHNMQGFDMVKAMDIVRCEADGSCTKIFLSSGKQIVSTKNLKHYADQWHGNLFYRTHRTHLVNVSHIIRYHKGGSGSLIMSNGSSVPIARNEKSGLCNFLQNKVNDTLQEVLPLV